MVRRYYKERLTHDTFYDLSEIVNKTSPLLSKANELVESRLEKVLNYDESIVKNKTFIEHLDSNQENLSSDSEKHV